MKKISLIAIMALVMGFVGSDALAQKNTQINWIEMNSIDDAIKETVENKRIFVDSYTDWCGWCKRMDRDTFADTLIAKIMNHYFINIKFDAETKDEIMFGGQVFKNPNPKGRRTAHELTHYLLNKRLSYPSYTVMNKDLTIATIIPGYYPPEQFEAMAVFLGGRYDEVYSWEEFREIYPKEIRETVLESLD